MEASNYIYKSLKDRVENILPKNREDTSILNDDYHHTVSPFAWLHYFVFVVEKFLNSKIPHRKYEIIYSSNYSTEDIHENSLKNLHRLERLLRAGDISVNKSSYGFLPRSSKIYFNSGNYNVDFANQFYGIKHFHICSDDRKRDELLYYVINENKIYFLSIGGHSKLYDQENIEILVREFPHITTKLGIMKMPDMPVGDSFEYSVEQLKKQWTSGSNSSFIIDGAYYTTTYSQTTSQLNADIINISNNIMYQFETRLNEFKDMLKEENKIISICHDDNSIVKNGNILIGDEISKTATEIRIPYLEKLEEVDQFLKIK